MSRKIAFAAALVAVASAFASAQEWRSRIEAALAVEDSCDYTDMALADIVRDVRQKAGVNIILDTADSRIDPARKLTLSFKDMSYANILTWICRVNGVEWAIQDEAILVAPDSALDEAARKQVLQRKRQNRVTAEKTWLGAVRKTLADKKQIDLRGKRIREAAQSLRDFLGINVICSPDADNRTPITLSLNDISGESIIAWVARKAGLDYAVLDQAVFLAPSQEILSIRSAGFDYSARGRAWDTVTVSLKNTPLDQGVAELAKAAGVEVALKCSLDEMPSVTLEITEMTLVDALRAVTRSADVLGMVDSSDGIILVSVFEKAEPKPVEEAPDADDTPTEDAGESAADELVEIGIEEAPSQ